MDIKGLNLPFKLSITTETEQWRAETFWDKEPETLKWINQFNNTGLFVDIGANIGLYSLYAAAKHPDLTIISIEPQLENYISLCLNVYRNNYYNIIPHYLAVGDTDELSIFTQQYNVAGATGGFFCSPNDKDNIRDFKKHWYSRLILQRRLDSLFSLLFGGRHTYLKIDTDANEKKIINGANNFIKKTTEILIEVNNENRQYIITQIKEKGFTEHDLNWISPHSRQRRNRENSKVENIIFKKI